MFCATHLVECLRNRGINPVALENTWYSSSYPKYALQYNKSKVYHSLEPPLNTLTIDFMTNVTISSYEIVSGNEGNFLVNWELAISNNYYNWETIDIHNKDIPPTQCGIITLSRPYNTRYVRFTGTKTFMGLQFFVVYYINFFGTYNRLCAFSCKTKRTLSSSVFFVLFCLLGIY